MVALATTASACSGAGAEEGTRTASTLGSAVAIPPGAVEISTSTVDVAEEDWAPEELIGPPLAPLSSAQQIRDAVEEVHGRTNDVAAQINRFVSFPTLPSPERPELLELRADVRNTLDGQWMIVTSEVSFAADGTPSDVVAFYREVFEGNGWQASRQGEQLQGGLLIHRLAYRIPDTAYDLDDLEVEIGPQPALGESPRTRVNVRYVSLERAAETVVQERLSGWAGDIPVPDGGRITGAGIQTSSLGRNSLHYSLVVAYDDKAPTTLADELRALLPVDGFVVDPQLPSGDATDNWVYLSSSFFDDARISTHDASDLAGPRTSVNIDARVEFAPHN